MQIPSPSPTYDHPHTDTHSTHTLTPTHTCLPLSLVVPGGWWVACTSSWIVHDTAACVPSLAASSGSEPHSVLSYVCTWVCVLARWMYVYMCTSLTNTRLNESMSVYLSHILPVIDIYAHAHPHNTHTRIHITGTCTNACPKIQHTKQPHTQAFSLGFWWKYQN